MTFNPRKNDELQQDKGKHTREQFFNWASAKIDYFCSLWMVQGKFIPPNQFFIIFTGL